MIEHRADVVGDHRVGWRWSCPCGSSAGVVYGDLAQARKASSAHLRLKRRKP